MRALFYGLGSDGTVGANKNSIKIIGSETPNYAQGYFVYDSKKSGSLTTSHLRFGPEPIRSTYLISRANFIACHQFEFLEKTDVLAAAEPGAIFLLNSPYGPNDVWQHLPRTIQKTILEKKLRFYVIDGYTVARENGMGTRINTVMQTCFFAISGVLPREEAIAQIKKAIKKTYGKRGDAVVQQNFAAVDAALAHLHEVKAARPRHREVRHPARHSQGRRPPSFATCSAPWLPATAICSPSARCLPAEPSPPATAKWEKRNIAQFIPVWDRGPLHPVRQMRHGLPARRHSRQGLRRRAAAQRARRPSNPPSRSGAAWTSELYTLQVSPEDCTGCQLCVEVCPAKSKSRPGAQSSQHGSRSSRSASPSAPTGSSSSRLPIVARDRLSMTQVKDIQLLEPLFEFSGACSGCGETPYIKLLTQLFGDRLMIANATGCSSIYGGNLPTTPYCQNDEGRGPAWSNSLFEDNAEFGLGMRLAVDQQKTYAEGPRGETRSRSR